MAAARWVPSSWTYLGVAWLDGTAVSWDAGAGVPGRVWDVWQPGQIFGEYELVAHLRDGGMASLYLARRLGVEGFQRELALKVIHPEFASDPDFQAMFVDEALLCARIRHPNVVAVEALGESQGTRFLAMEYVHGCCLLDMQNALRLRGRRLSPAMAAYIAMQIAEGLHGAHETRDASGQLLNVVHRDVSPENVLLSYQGHIKLIDFGIAKASGRRHRTRQGLLKGKYHYMAPEQANGLEVDRRTDVYQLGVVLWELLTLQRMLDCDDEAELIRRVRSPRAMAPGRVVPGIPPALDGVVLAALQPDRAQRPATAQEFRRLLGAAVPEALQVDAPMLHEMLLGLTEQHRETQRQSLPVDVLERLEGHVPTALEPHQAPSAAPTAPGAGWRSHTLEIQAAAVAPTEPAIIGPHGGGTTALELGQVPLASSPHPSRPTDMEGSEGRSSGEWHESAAASAPPHRRERREVHLAARLKTRLSVLGGPQQLGLPRWMLLVCALAFGIATPLFILSDTAWWRPEVTSAVVPAPPVPEAVVPAGEAAAAIADVPAAQPPAAPEIGTVKRGDPEGDVLSPARREARAARRARRRARRRATGPDIQRVPGAARLPSPRMVDGTPLVFESGL